MGQERGFAGLTLLSQRQHGCLGEACSWELLECSTAFRGLQLGAHRGGAQLVPEWVTEELEEPSLHWAEHVFHNSILFSTDRLLWPSAKASRPGGSSADCLITLASIRGTGEWGSITSVVQDSSPSYRLLRGCWVVWQGWFLTPAQMDDSPVVLNLETSLERAWLAASSSRSLYQLYCSRAYWSVGGKPGCFWVKR